DRIIPLLEEHMAIEETRALPLIEKYITATEWEGIGQDAMATVAQDRLPVMLGMVLYEAEPASLEQTLSRLPGDQRNSVRDGAMNAYAQYDERLYGTATPPRHNP